MTDFSLKRIKMESERGDGSICVTNFALTRLPEGIGRSRGWLAKITRGLGSSRLAK